MHTINKLFFVCALFLIMGAHGQGYITEIINNTDTEIAISAHDGAEFHVVRSYLLKDSTETQPKIPQSPISTKLAPRTKNIIIGLKIPIVNASFHDHNYLKHSIQLQLVGSKSGVFGFLVRQRGDLLEFFNGGTIVNEVQFSSGLIVKNSSAYFPYLSNENVATNAYSIEINEYNVKINKTNHIPHHDDDVRPKAQIVGFYDNNTPIKAVVGFDKIISNNFFNKFMAIIKNNKFFSSISKIGIQDNGKRLLTLDLYTKISKSDFQKHIDILNQTPL